MKFIAISPRGLPTDQQLENLRHQISCLLADAGYEDEEIEVWIEEKIFEKDRRAYWSDLF